MQKDTIKLSVSAACLAAVTLLGGFFFSMTGIKVAQALTVNLLPLLKEMTSVQFALFVLFSSIAIAIVLFIGKKAEYRQALAFSAAGYLIGAIIAIVAFSLSEFILPAIFLVIGIVPAIKMLEKKEAELKFMPKIRGGMFASGKIIGVVGAGLFLLLIITTLSAPAYYEEKFALDLISVVGSPQDVLGSAMGTVEDQIANTLPEVIVSAQEQTITSIKQLPGYAGLQQKNDADANNFTTAMDRFEENVQSAEYKNALGKQIKSQQKAQNQIVAGYADENQLAAEFVKAMPIMQKVSPFAWIIDAILPLILFFIIGSLIVKNLAGAIYALMTLLVGKGKKAGGEKPVEAEQ